MNENEMLQSLLGLMNNGGGNLSGMLNNMQDLPAALKQLLPLINSFGLANNQQAPTQSSAPDYDEIAKALHDMYSN